eukprot:TRINITY_DN15114_c0_g1_i1.p1 TRINITY_DN15114_c0_g1~~TRINITY_DN15114_c0_g1_i1.p1  ORF type:complete len:661 (+),score=250.08 TRINITY_DN15114_c0_g1_i1:62-1984(+)
MPCVVNVAADIGGAKLNFELEFPFTPSLAELIRQTEAAFGYELHTRRPGSPPFQVSKLQVVDESSDDWVEVVAAHQLRHQCQVYAFQPHSTRYTEAQEHIPPATRPRGFLTGGASAVPAVAVAPGYAAGSPLAPVSAAPPSYALQNAAASPLRAAPVLAPRPGGGVRPASPAPLGGGTSCFRTLTAGDNASHDDKVRATFEELDSNSNRVIESEEFRKGLRVCTLDLSVATANDLFQEADADADGVINFAEWQRFGELYPTLLDFLYFRFKSHWEYAAQEQQVDHHRGLRAALDEAERQAQARYAQAQLDAEEAARRLSEADRAAADASNRQRAAEDTAREATRDVDRARQLRADRERDLAAERDRERQSQMRAQDSARELDGSQRTLAAAQSQLSEAEAAEHRATQMLADARRERERQVQVVERAMADAQRATDRHNQVLAELPRGVEEAAARLAQADQELAHADGAARDLAVKAQDSSRVADDAVRSRDQQGQHLQATRDGQEPARLAWIEAQRALEEHDRQVAEMEAALAADAESRRQLEDHEKGLVEQEIRLREQRKQLVEREKELRTAHMSFFQMAGRTSPARHRPGASPAHAKVTTTVVSSREYTSSSSVAAACSSGTAAYGSSLRGGYVSAGR